MCQQHPLRISNSTPLSGSPRMLFLLVKNAAEISTTAFLQPVVRLGDYGG